MPLFCSQLEAVFNVWNVCMLRDCSGVHQGLEVMHLE